MGARSSLPGRAALAAVALCAMGASIGCAHDVTIKSTPPGAKVFGVLTIGQKPDKLALPLHCDTATVATCAAEAAGCGLVRGRGRGAGAAAGFGRLTGPTSPISISATGSNPSSIGGSAISSTRSTRSSVAYS